MKTLTRPFPRRWGTSRHEDFAPGFAAGERPCTAPSVQLAPMSATMSGPVYKGMDPSDPATWVRPWEPASGMIAYLNFDGARYQDYTPTGGLQRGRQSRRRG